MYYCWRFLRPGLELTAAAMDRTARLLPSEVAIAEHSTSLPGPVADRYHPEIIWSSQIRSKSSSRANQKIRNPPQAGMNSYLLTHLRTQGNTPRPTLKTKRPQRSASHESRKSDYCASLAFVTSVVDNKNRERCAVKRPVVRPTLRELQHRFRGDL